MSKVARVQIGFPVKPPLGSIPVSYFDVKEYEIDFDDIGVSFKHKSERRVPVGMADSFLVPWSNVRSIWMISDENMVPAPGAVAGVPPKKVA